MSKTPWDFGHQDATTGRGNRLARDGEPRTKAARAYLAGLIFGICESYDKDGQVPPGGFPHQWDHKYRRAAHA